MTHACAGNSGEITAGTYLSDRVGNPSRFEINYRDCHGDFRDVTGPWNRDITRFYVGRVEFSGVAINYSKANLAARLREPAIEVVGQGEIRKVTSRDSRNPDCPTNPGARGEVVKKRSRD